MTTRMQMQSRRSLLTILSTSALGMIMPEYGLRTSRHGATLAERMTSLLSNPDDAGLIGRTHLHSRPADADVDRLTHRLTSSAGGGARLMHATDGTLRRFLAALRQREFECGRTVCVGGWVLAESEATLCALTALLPNARRGLSIRADAHA